MKTYKHLWENLITKENFELAYKNAIKGKKKQRQIVEFMKDEQNNLERVRQLVISGEFHTSEYRSMTIYEPKERVIYKLPFDPDRIVQHAIMNVLKPILINLFIENSYACIEGRGTHRASTKCAEYTRRFDYCLKCDIKKFYPSIDQRVLSDMFHRIIKDEQFLVILDDVIFSFRGGKNAPIGNYCSQWFGNFYLTKMDNFILHDLKCKGYIRYCDDFLLFDNDKRYLQICKERLMDFLQSVLCLQFSKANVTQTRLGIDFCGYRHFKKYVLLRKTTAKRIKREMKHINKALDDEAFDKERLVGQVASIKGQLKHCCSYHYQKAISLSQIERRVCHAT